MDDVSDVPLTFCTTAELLEELSSRHDAFVVISIKSLAADDQLMMHVKGPAPVCSGLVDEARSCLAARRDAAWADSMYEEGDDG